MSQELLMPALSPSMTEGKLAKWLVPEGAAVNAGDIIAEIETDKATLEFEAPISGILARILVAEGTEGVAVDQAVAVIRSEGEPVNTEPTPEIQQPAGPSAAETPNHSLRSITVPIAATPAESSAAQRIFASPLARVIAAQSSIDLHGISGTGPGKRIVKADVEKALAARGKVEVVSASRKAAEAPAAEPPKDQLPQPWQGYDATPNSTLRKTIARRLLESKQRVPHFYLTASIEMDRVLTLRAELNARPGAAYKLSINDFVIKAAAFALRQVPEANAMWTDDAILRFKDIDISVAVSIDGGLVTPVIRNAANKGLQAISDEMKELAARARANKLKPEEYQGGGFSITNLGMFGIEQFSAIINPPQSCILALGSTEKRAVVNDEDAVVVKSMMTATLSVDHRSVDGVLGARLLSAVKAALEEPLSMML